MGFGEDLFEALGECLDDNWDYRESNRSNGLGGRHRYVVNYVSENGTSCGVEILAYTNGQARDSVKYILFVFAYWIIRVFTETSFIKILWG